MSMEINKFPLLLKNYWVKMFYTKVCKLHHNEAKTTMRLTEAITKVQNKCPHATFYYEKDDRFDAQKRGNKIGALLSKTCIDCGFQPVKPKGKDSEVCAYCWSTEMEYLGRDSSQDRWFHYKCKSCGREHTHT